MELKIYILILDIAMIFLGIILFLELMQASKRTQNNLFKYMAGAAGFFVAMNFINFILDTFFSISLDMYGYHQLTSIITSTLLIFIFRPSWKSRSTNRTNNNQKG